MSKKGTFSKASSDGSVEEVSIEAGSGSTPPMPPKDDSTYGIKNEEWTKIENIGGIEEAPADGKQYARKNEAWSVVEGGSSEAPIIQGNDPANGRDDSVVTGIVRGKENVAISDNVHILLEQLKGTSPDPDNFPNIDKLYVKTTKTGTDGEAYLEVDKLKGMLLSVTTEAVTGVRRIEELHFSKDDESKRIENQDTELIMCYNDTPNPLERCNIDLTIEENLARLFIISTSLSVSNPQFNNLSLSVNGEKKQNSVNISSGQCAMIAAYNDNGVHRANFVSINAL